MNSKCAQHEQAIQACQPDEVKPVLAQVTCDGEASDIGQYGL